MEKVISLVGTPLGTACMDIKSDIVKITMIHLHVTALKQASLPLPLLLLTATQQL
jgi:hypothetical protein